MRIRNPERFICNLLVQVKRRCIAAEPHHGPLWCRYSKDIRYWQEKPEFFLLLGANNLLPPT